MSAAADHRRAVKRAWAAANPEKVEAHMRKFRAAHPGYFAAYIRRWRKQKANAAPVALPHLSRCPLTD